ncbi:MAG: glutamate--tRNA ligase, partial [Candidatus Micrarchaeaceae archaeon]
YGHAKTSIVVNKIISIYPELRNNIKDIFSKVNNIVAEVNALSKDALTKEFEPYFDEFEIKEKEIAEKTSKPRMILEGAVEGNFITRYAPEPNGYLHIGHALNIFLGQEFAHIYKGKDFLYFDDTNPTKEDEKFVEEIKKNLDWLGVKFDKEYYASDNIEKIYEFARLLIKSGKAYACICSTDEIKSNRMNKIGCKHKNQSSEENLNIFEKMLKNEFNEEDVVIRLALDMNSKNSALRDPVILRIKKHKHYKQGNKYVVWPTYDFNTPINDSLQGITDVFRDKWYEIRSELYRILLESLGLKAAQIHPYARLEIKDNITSKREINELIKQGIIKGFDDPRLVTLSALRRRGINPEAIRNFVLKFGISKAEREIDIDMLLAENRKVVDKNAKRLFFVENPIKLEIEKIDEKLKNIKIKLHPNKDLGYKTYKLSNIFFITGDDAKNLKINDIILLKDLFKIKITKLDNNIKAAIVEGAKDQVRVIHWVNEGNYENALIKKIEPILKNNEINPTSMRDIKGYVEKYVDELDEGNIVNFERMGFFKLDNKKERIFFSL